MKEEKVFIPADGIRLEGLLSIQEAPSSGAGVICCHPHPQFGGEMSHPVVTAALEAAFEEGFSTLRFNFRGVGESEGVYGDGIGERQDVRAAADYLDSRLKNRPPRFILVGYSFGAWAGFPVAVQDERFVGMVAIAPPLEIYDFGFLKACRKRKFFIAGDHDAFCPSSLLEGWVQQLDDPKSLALIPGADHFLFGHTHLLVPPLKEFFKKISSER